MSGGMAATAMRHCHGRQQVVQSGSGGRKRRKKVTINQKCGSMSGGMVELPCDIIAASGESNCQRKVF